MKRFTKYTIIRYLIGGGSSAVVNLFILYFTNTILGIYYLTSSIIAFCIAFFVSLVLHKFWTFKDHSIENMHKQGAMYLLSSLFGLSLNTLLMYIFVSLIHLPVILSQIFAGILVACCSYFISKHIIFKNGKKDNIYG